LYTKIFKDLFESEKSKATLLLGVTLLAVVIIFLVAIILAISVVTTTDMIMLMFGHMTHYEVDKEIENCNCFLEVFYQDSYMIRLKNRQKMRETANINSYSNDGKK